MRRLDGRVALVTGAASGIGAATAKRLAAEGAVVVATDVDVDGAEKVAADIGGLGLPLDVADPVSVRLAVDVARREAGPVDVLVNNAGIDAVAYFLDSDEDDWDRVLLVNLRGAMSCTKAVLGAMHEQRRGAIVNVASEAGRVGAVGGAAYAAAKAGLIGFTKAIARESARYGVRCNAVAPGPVDTPLLERAAQLRQGMVDATVMRRAGTPEEIAGAVAYLASDDASFVTGETLAVSGGLSMW